MFSKITEMGRYHFGIILISGIMGIVPMFIKVIVADMVVMPFTFFLKKNIIFMKLSSSFYFSFP
jgi:hypothetical protein